MLNHVFDWYGRIPPLNSEEFTRFLGRSVKFISYITENKNMLPALDVRFASKDTAYCDPTKNLVVLPIWPLTPDKTPFPVRRLSETRGPDRAALVLGLYNGFIIHEAHHLKYSMRSVQAMMQAACPEGVADTRLLTGLLQITEDLYIDDRALAKPYHIFIRLLLHTLLNDEVCQERYEKLVSERNRGNLINLLITYKNPDNRGADLWADIPAGIVDLFETVYDTHDAAARARIAYEVYKIIYNDPETEDSGMHDPLVQTSSEAFDGEYTGEVDCREIDNSALARAQAEVVAELNQSPEAGRAVPPVRMVPLPRHAVPLRPDASFRGLGTVLRLLQSTNWTYGTPRKFGSRIIPTRLARARTDQKIFGIARPKDSAVETEVILLIDASGSMHHMIEKVTSAAFASYQSIKQARLRCGVYAHTSDHKMPQLYPVITELAATVPDAAQRFGKIPSINLCENFDGYAIEATVKQFSQRDGEKVLLVFSDGRPNGPNYRGEEAVEHTTHTVKSLRKAGYRIISISLTSDVLATNDRIYGRGFNVDASGSRLVPQLKEVIQRIAAGEI